MCHRLDNLSQHRAMDEQRIQPPVQRRTEEPATERRETAPDPAPAEREAEMETG